jgi:hypothetical protein
MSGNLWRPFLKLKPYILAGFDPTTLNSAIEDNTARVRRQGLNLWRLKFREILKAIKHKTIWQRCRHFGTHCLPVVPLEALIMVRFLITYLIDFKNRLLDFDSKMF